MSDTLNLIKVPDTNAMRALSEHLKVSADGYDEHLNRLNDNQAQLVQKNWQGEGASAYVQANGQLTTIGEVHVDQMQRASKILDQTADAIDAGNRVQDAAQRDWDIAEGYVREGYPEAAVPYYISAQVLRDEASVTLLTAQAEFNTSFANLTAEISRTPSMSSMTRDPYLVKEIHAKPGGKLPMTPPLTPPASPPLGPVDSPALKPIRNIRCRLPHRPPRLTRSLRPYPTVGRER